MIITVTTLAVLALAIAAPNYLAVRYAVFGGSPVAPATTTTAEAPAGLTLAKGRPARRQLLAKLTQRGYLWKALSPLLFAASVILGLGLGGVVGISLVALAFLNLIWGALGWDGYVAGRK